MKPSVPPRNPELALSKILDKFDTADRHELASQLHYGFGLSISDSYPLQLERILGRPLSRDESFVIGVLHRLAVLQGFDGTGRQSRKKVVKRAKKVVKRAAKRAAKKAVKKAHKR